MTHESLAALRPNASPQPESASSSAAPTDRITRWLLIAIGIYTSLLVTLLNIFLFGSGKTIERAIILMADGLILFWIVIGGALTPMLRRRLVPRLAAIPINWRLRFVLLCTVMALIEEVITTSMTNLAPLLGTTPEAAHITASTNYFTVVCFHSVIVFVPMFIAWAWMLSRWALLRLLPHESQPTEETMIRSIIALFVIAATASAQIVPAPQHAQLDPAHPVTGHIVRCDAPEFHDQVDTFVAALRKLGVANAAATADPKARPVVIFFKKDSLPSEGYTIASSETHLTVSASASEGAAYAAASLLQTVTVRDGRATWPHMAIEDHPDHSYRSFMVDMGRNPHSPATLRQVVDMMWFYKANYLHLHLTDDQLFCWPSRAFPKLYSTRAGWTWSDFVALEDYSQARGVTIIPELEVPGHSSILRRVYPEIFGKTTTELATKPEAQQGIETLIAELLSVFKATPYFHIGGDEAGGVPVNDQRDLINRLNTFVNAQGKRTIVWEGPDLGAGRHKVAENVVHMNWRTINFPAQQMLDAGYEVVNASWDPLYVVDHYPRTMFTAVDVERCYNWDIQRFAHINHTFPTFKEPHRTETARGILGFCMPWWEGRQENLMPLCLPRLAAVTSAAWNREGESSFADYQKRQKETLPILEKLADFELPKTPFADPESQKDNLAFRAKVTPSDGASQPHFGPARLTNGIPDRFDHFLGFPTQPKPLEILIELATPATVGRVVVYERAIGTSHEIYDLLVSADGKVFEKIGSAQDGSRGDTNHVEHAFPARKIRFIKIITQGCHGLTFPSFSRLSEVMAFAE